MHRGQAGDGVRTRSRKRGQQRARLHQGEEKRKKAGLRDQINMGQS